MYIMNPAAGDWQPVRGDGGDEGQRGQVTPRGGQTEDPAASVQTEPPNAPFRMDYKNYIFDLYATLVEIHTDQGPLPFWEKAASLMNAFGTAYEPAGMRSRYRALIGKEEAALALRFGTQWPEADLGRIFEQMLLEGCGMRARGSQPPDAAGAAASFPASCADAPGSLPPDASGAAASLPVSCADARGSLLPDAAGAAASLPVSCADAPGSQPPDAAGAAAGLPAPDTGLWGDPRGWDRAAMDRWCSFYAWAFRVASRIRFGLYPDTLTTLGRLKNENKRIFLLSNAQSLFTRPELRELGLAGAFEDVFISSEHHVRKPEPAFLQKMLEKHRLDPAETLMIGNDLEADVKMAVSCGVNAFLVNHDGYGEEAIRRGFAAALDAAPAARRAALMLGYGFLTDIN